MLAAIERIDPVRLWLTTGIAGIIVLVAGSALFPRLVYERFIWQYFWGPVDADAHGVACSVRHGGEIFRFATASECYEMGGIVAQPGYTSISTISYALVLVFALIGVLFLLQRRGIGTDSGFFFALFPFMLFGGALRVVEDVNVVMIREGTILLSFPWSGLLISPFIYFTVFFIALATLVISLWLERSGNVDRYEYPLATIGTVFLVGTVTWLVWQSVRSELIGFNPAVPIITLVGATVITVITWVLIERYKPDINAGTGAMGALVIWGHTVDGVANVLSLDWAPLFGLPSYSPKHVINQAIVDITGAIQPAWLSETIGTAWPFLFVKVGVAVIVVWIFDEQLMDESPRYAILLLIAILAVGIGPGTRDFLRATFGI